jgi:hypothetical protein
MQKNLYTDTEGLISGESSATNVSRNIGYAAWGLLLVTFALAVAAFVGACMLWSNWNAIQTLKDGCSPDRVDKYSLVERSPDADALDWKIQGRDLYSSSYNGHLSNLGTNIKRATGFCPNGVNSISATSNGVGITVTPTVSSELNMVFFADHGVVGTHTGTTLYAVSLASCVTVWSKTMTGLTSVTIPNNADAGVDNPVADIYSSMQIVKNSTNQYVVVFTDFGTSAYYNLTMCSTNFSGLCGVRLFVLDALTGEPLHRTLLNTLSGLTYYNQADQNIFSPIVYQGTAYTGVSSNQSYDVLTTDVIDFFAAINGVDIDSGLVVMEQNVIADSQIAAGNFGGDITGTPPIDIDSGMVIYGSGRLLNQSEAIATCLQSVGGNRINCMPYGLGTNQLFSKQVVVPGTVGSELTPQWYYSPYGVDAWNAGCLTGTGVPCPVEHGPTAAFATGSIVVKNQCGQRFVISMGQTGTLYSVDVLTGIKQWTTYIGPSSNATATYGLSFDGNSVWFALGNLDKKSYLTLNGVRRCDSMWAKVNAWTGEIQEIIPVPCSRASTDCPAIVPDPYLADSFPADILDFSNRGTAKNGSALYCPTSAPDLRLGAFGATAVGSVITTNKLMLAGSFSGHMHVYNHDGGYITSLAQCDSGIVFGGASISKLENGRTLLSWGCGYGTGPYPAAFGDSELRVLSVA